jgi:hypothetical protein
MSRDKSERSASAGETKGPSALGGTTAPRAGFAAAQRNQLLPVQMKSAGPSPTSEAHTAASHGVSGAPSALPHAPQIQQAFGHHDVSGIGAHTDGAAADANDELGSHGYAMGENVAFADSSPDLHTAAHESAHVIQQRGGVALKGGVSEPGDPYEAHADAVADAVVAGQSAEGLLDTMAPGGGTAAPTNVQQDPKGGTDKLPSKKSVTWAGDTFDVTFSTKGKGSWDRKVVFTVSYTGKDLVQFESDKHKTLSTDIGSKALDASAKVSGNSIALDLYGDGSRIITLSDQGGPYEYDKNKNAHHLRLAKDGRTVVSASTLFIIKELTPAKKDDKPKKDDTPKKTAPKVEASSHLKLKVGRTPFDVWWEKDRNGLLFHVKYTGPNWCPVADQKLLVLRTVPAGDPKLSLLSNSGGVAHFDLDGDGVADYSLKQQVKFEEAKGPDKHPERTFRFDLVDKGGKMVNWTAHLVRGPIEAEEGKAPGVNIPAPTPLDVNFNGDKFKIRSRRIGDTNDVMVDFEYTGKEQVNRKKSSLRVLRKDKLTALTLKALVNNGRDLHLDLSGSGKADLILVHTVNGNTSGDGRNQVRRHYFRQFDKDQQFKGELSFWVTGKAQSIPDNQDEKKSAPNTNAEFPTTAPPTQGNNPGERPKNYLKSGGITEIRLDGDGDQSKDLVVRVKKLEAYEGGSAKKAKVQIIQLLTGEVRETEFDLPKQDFGGQWLPITSDVTDGHGPNIIDLTRKEQLKIYPASRQQTGVHYKLMVAGVTKTLSFPPNTNPLRTIASTTKEQTAGGIHAVDLKLGAFNDQFRVTLDRASGTPKLGISALNSGKTSAPYTIELKPGWGTRLKALKTEGLHVALDLNGDKKADVEIYDQMQEPAHYDGGGDAKKKRNHRVRVRGAAVAKEKQLFFQVNYGTHMVGAAGGKVGSDQQLVDSASKAVDSLGEQKRLGSFAEQLASYEGALFKERKAALDKGYISKTVYDAWVAISTDMVILRPQVNAGKVDAKLKADAAAHAQAFYKALAADTKNEFVRRNGGPGGQSHTNRFTGDKTIGAGKRAQPGAGSKLSGTIQKGKWTQAYNDYQSLVSGLDSYIHTQITRKEGKNDKDAQRTGYLGGMKRELGSIQKHRPQKVHAVFHPDSKYAETGRVGEVPLQLYIWHDGSEWHLKDLTNPDNTFEDTIASSDTREPPRALFKELNYKSHFPKGIIRYETPSGKGDLIRTTERKTLSDWLTYIGLGVAAIGLGLATFGTGTVAVAGAWVLAGAGVINAAAAGASLYEKAKHGHLTAGSAALDILQIVASLAGVGAITSGRIVVQAASAASKGTPWAGNLARLAGYAQKAYVPLTATAIGADGITVAVMSVNTLKQLEQIENGPGSRRDKNRAKALLLANLAVAGGLLALSIKGDLPNLKGGPDIHVDMVDGVPVARLTAARGPTAHGGPAPKAWVKLAPNIEVPAGSNARLASAKKLKFTQENIAPTTGDGALTIDELTGIMKTKGWRGDPLEVVEMPDGSLVSLDNRRLVAAQRAGLENVPISPHKGSAAFPKDWAANGFKLKKSIRRLPNGELVVGGSKGEIVMGKGHIATTYEEAVLIRTANQGKIKGGPSSGQSFPLGGTHATPRVRPPKPGPTRTGQASRTAGAVEEALTTHGGKLPDEAVNAIMKGLPDAKIDPGDPLGGIGRYLAGELKVPAGEIKVTLLGGGYSGAGVYAVKHKDKVIGIFKVFRDQAEMLREVAALKRIADLNLATLKPVALGTLGKTGGGRGVGLMEPAQGDFVVDTMKSIKGLSGDARMQALSKLQGDVGAVGKGLGELAEASKGKGNVSGAQKAKEVSFFEKRWQGIMATSKPGGGPVISPREQAQLRAKLDEALQGFKNAEVPTAIAHGDAHGGNFSVGKNGTVNTIDVETLFRSVGADGKPIASMATDVGRFNEWIAITGLQQGMNPAEIKKLQDAFLDSFLKASGSARGTGEALARARKFYELNFASVQLKTDMTDSAGKFIAGFDPNTSVGMKRLKALLGL